MDVQTKRVYEESTPSDGTRVLVDRLWPRGLSKAAAHLDEWEKEAAPSAELRKQWHQDAEAHDPRHLAAFAKHYRAELSGGLASEAVDRLVALATHVDRLTLLYGIHDPALSHAPILREVVLERASLRDSSVG